MSNSNSIGKRLATTAILAICILVGWGSYALLAWVAPDIMPDIESDRSESVLYEDGSYALGIGNFTISGCAPVHFWNGKLVTGWCLDGGDSVLGYFKRGQFVRTISIDSPWEDFMSEPFSDWMYRIISIYKSARDALAREKSSALGKHSSIPRALQIVNPRVNYLYNLGAQIDQIRV